MTQHETTRELLLQALDLARAIEANRARNRIAQFYPDEDAPGFPARRRYPKHMEFFRLGATVSARFAMAANGLGKTEGLGGYECIHHWRGEYPEWWEGVRYEHPIDSWVVGLTHESVREILQRKLLGNPYEEEMGGGLIPTDWIVPGSIKRMSTPAGRIDSFEIKHVSGGKSRIKLKSYDQGVDAFFGNEVPLIWLDEPPPVDIYSQCVARGRNVEKFRILITATPVKMDQQQRETVRMFLEKLDPTRAVVKAGWADAPHLTDEYKSVTRANTPAYLLAAVEHGDPTRVGGAVFQIREEDITVDPFPIPGHWKWCYGMDTGFHHTACVIIAYDEDSDTAYIVEDYQDGGQDLRTGEVIDYTIHATRIRARSRIRAGFDNVPGVGDAAAINLKDGSKMIDLYKACGLDLELPNKAVAAGLAEMTSRFGDGRLKVFKTCHKFLQQFREYSADEQGRPIKVNDHLIDSARYGVYSGLGRAASRGSMVRAIGLPSVRFG